MNHVMVESRDRITRIECSSPEKKNAGWEGDSYLGRPLNPSASIAIL
jgi:hypothetical protein